MFIKASSQGSSICAFSLIQRSVSREKNVVKCRVGWTGCGMCALGFTFRSFLVTKVQQSLLVAEWSVQGAATWVPPLLANIDIYSWCAYSIFIISSRPQWGHRQLFWVFPSPAWESPSISSRTGLWASASQNEFLLFVSWTSFPLTCYGWFGWVPGCLFDYQSMNEWLISNEKFGDVSGVRN